MNYDLDGELCKISLFFQIYFKIFFLFSFSDRCFAVTPTQFDCKWTNEDRCKVSLLMLFLNWILFSIAFVDFMLSFGRANRNLAFCDGDNTPGMHLHLSNEIVFKISIFKIVHWFSKLQHRQHQMWSFEFFHFLKKIKVYFFAFVK